jgi:LmbE family N-acetylglucosaminyl deacetylase
MDITTGNFDKVLVFVAHPDDESIACAGLMQRARRALVVFAVDGAPPYYRFEKKFGSLRAYSDCRFREAAAALATIPDCSYRRLTRPDGTYFVDQHLFLEMPEAFASLLNLAREFSPDWIVSHAFEGGHLDHDTCHVLAKHAAATLGIESLEFPLYWRSAENGDCFQRFREKQQDESALQLSAQELLTKRRMVAEYRSQQTLTSVFQQEIERFRRLVSEDCSRPVWSEYPFENRRKPWKADLFFEKIANFQNNCRRLRDSSSTMCQPRSKRLNESRR